MSIDKHFPKTLAEIAASRPDVDLTKIDSATDEEIDAYQVEDGVSGLDWGGAVRVLRPAAPDVRTIRQHLGLTREAFANAFGLDFRAVEAWEQHHREPDRAARVLLAVIALDPEIVKRAVAQRAA